MKKKKLTPLESMMKQGYEAITKVPVYCKICGQEIIWEPYPNGTQKPRHIYEQELMIEAHQVCLSRLARR
jgi:hypothetical protein